MRRFATLLTLLLLVGRTIGRLHSRAAEKPADTVAAFYKRQKLCLSNASPSLFTSTSTCIGEDLTPNAAFSKTCWYRNVCYNTKRDDFDYFLAGDVSGEIKPFCVPKVSLKVRASYFVITYLMKYLRRCLQASFQSEGSGVPWQ